MSQTKTRIRKDLTGDAARWSIELTGDAARWSTGGRARWACRIPIKKYDGVRRRAFGWASVVVKGGAIVVDHHDDVIPVPELEGAAYDYVLEHRIASDSHERMGVGRLIESLVLTPDKPLRATDLPPDSIGWWVGFQVDDDEVVKRLERGELGELSIGGWALRVPHSTLKGALELRDLEVEEIAFVDAGAGLDVKVAVFKRRSEGGAWEDNVVKLTRQMLQALRKLREQGKHAEAEDILTALRLHPKVAKTEVMTLADVQAALDEELWGVVLQAIEAAKMGTGTEAPVDAALPEPEKEEEPTEKAEEPTTAAATAPMVTTKALDAELAEMKKQRETDQQALTAMRQKVEKAEHAQRIEKMRARVTKDLYCVPGKDADIADALISLEDIEAANGAPVIVPIAVAKTLRTVLEQAHEVVKFGGGLQTFGHSGPVDDDDVSPVAKMKRIAKTLQEGDKTLTDAKALAMACKQNPALYKDYLAAQKRKEA